MAVRFEAMSTSPELLSASDLLALVEIGARLGSEVRLSNLFCRGDR